MKILSLDLADQMGWAWYENGKIRSGTVSFHLRESDGAGVRFLKFENWLLKLLVDEPAIITYELVRAHSSTAAGHIYGGYVHTLTKTAEKFNVSYTGYAVATIKKHWTGNGAAKKDKMIEEANRRGFNPKDDNEADALAILHLTLDEFSFLISDS